MAASTSACVCVCVLEPHTSTLHHRPLPPPPQGDITTVMVTSSWASPSPSLICLSSCWSLLDTMLCYAGLCYAVLDCGVLVGCSIFGSTYTILLCYTLLLLCCTVLCHATVVCLSPYANAVYLHNITACQSIISQLCYITTLGHSQYPSALRLISASG